MTQEPTLPTQPTPSPTVTIQGNARDTLVGAIRWDAWVGEMPTFGEAESPNRVGLVVERTLAAEKWHYRLPFFARVLAPDQVEARGATQAIMDQEIELAASAGLDYWAFVYYPPGSGLDTSRRLYLASKINDRIGFALIIDSPRQFLDEKSRALFIDYFLHPQYVKVAGGRPLLYIFGNTGLSREGVNLLRTDAQASSSGNPYLVYMDWSAADAQTNIDTHGLDAGSAYAQLGSNGQPFTQLASAARGGWAQYAKAGIQVVPWVSTGWDPRPRVEVPTPWVTYPANQWAETAQPAEIAVHLQEALAWSARNPEQSEANTIIIYAWNEFDEGGWLCPTLFNGSDRLDAIRPVLTTASP
jgi:hypothetical protein